MSAETWDQDGDAYRRYLDSGGAAEDAHRLREARQQRNGGDVDYFAKRAAWALTAKAAAEQRAAALTAALDQEQARVRELEAELGTCTDDEQHPACRRMVAWTVGAVAAWTFLLGAGWLLWTWVLPSIVEAVSR